MDKILDLHYEHKAANFLHAALAGCFWEVQSKNLGIDKEKLVSIFRDMCRLINQGDAHSKEYMCAEAVISSCIRIVKCICLNAEVSYTLIHGGSREINALSHYENSVKNYEHMKELKKC
ncbi:hypothetical protein GCM10011348_04810 [Marinobacterium nitratireducens]|uniref:Uncharacterized protein n=1 Tax=Marinobacterium nitratireducens TaxID=518897 RepID=A0A918DPC8_9GAMM|nr:hypothetical protein GCM10011348_04810 [Marinobacterium nitratireducens]